MVETHLYQQKSEQWSSEEMKEALKYAMMYWYSTDNKKKKDDDVPVLKMVKSGKPIDLATFKRGGGVNS